jgi:hypothetical protein
MKRVSAKNSLAILCILAGIIYLLILIPSIVDGIEGGIQGAKDGFQSTMNEDRYGGFDHEGYFLKLKLKDKKNYYPDSILNTATHEIIPARIKNIDVFYQFKESPSLWSILFLMFLMLGSFPILILLIFIPILFYKLIFALYRNDLFTQENVVRIERIGIFCIIVYAYMLLFQLYNYIQAKTVIDLEKYKIAFPEFSNEMLLFGVIALIIAIVMKRAIAIKEEQDLTI